MFGQRKGKGVSRASWAVGSAALTAGLALTTAAPASAAPPQTFELPAGTACSFALKVVQSGGEHRVDKEFRDQNGNLVRLLSAGQGFGLTITNTDTGAQSHAARQRVGLAHDGQPRRHVDRHAHGA